MEQERAVVWDHVFGTHGALIEMLLHWWHGMDVASPM